MRLAEVVVVAAQAYAECARRGRFGVPPVRAWVLRRIAMQHAPGAAPVEAQKKSCEHKKNARNARGNVIEHIVETRRYPAKVQILRVLVAEHRIHSIRRAIEHSERQPANQIEKERCKNAVKKVLEAVEAKDGEAAVSSFDMAQSVIDKAVVKGVMHRNTATRRKKMMALRIKSLDA